MLNNVNKTYSAILHIVLEKRDIPNLFKSSSQDLYLITLIKKSHNNPTAEVRNLYNLEVRNLRNLDDLR